MFDDGFIGYLFDLVEQTREIQDETFNYSVIKLIVGLPFDIPFLYDFDPVSDEHSLRSTSSLWLHQCRRMHPKTMRAASSHNRQPNRVAPKTQTGSCVS